MKRRAAYFAAARYVLLSVATAFAAWLQQLGKQGWDTLSTFDVFCIVTALVIAALTALGAVMNSSWADAKTEAEEASDTP